MFSSSCCDQCLIVLWGLVPTLRWEANPTHRRTISFTTFLRKMAASVILMALTAAPMFAQDWNDHEGHRIRHFFVIVLENEGVA